MLSVVTSIARSQAGLGIISLRKRHRPSPKPRLMSITFDTMPEQVIATRFAPAALQFHRVQETQLRCTDGRPLGFRRSLAQFIVGKLRSDVPQRGEVFLQESLSALVGPLETDT